MDIFSHGLWGGVLFGRKNKLYFYLALLFGVLPDLLSFGVFTIAVFFGFSYRIDWSAGPPEMDSIPEYVHMLYNISHSLVLFSAVFILVWIIRKKPFIPFLAYGFAVALDIPTHTAEFFGTPFLWPISNYNFDGTSWGSPIIFLPNVIFLIIAYLIWYIFQRKKKASR